MKKHLLGGLSALLVFVPVFVIGADGWGQGHEMSSSEWISNVGCTSVINSSSCDYTGPSKSLRKGYEYEFSDEFWAGSQDRRMKNFCAQFKEQSEHGDFNEGTNPNFQWTSDIASNGYWVNKNSSMVVIKADKLYQIKAVPDSRSESNLFIKYVIEYANNEAATTRYHHTECFPYEISRCGDGVVDKDWFKKDPNDSAEECDYNDPNKTGWKDGSGKTCDKSCKLVDIVPVCSSTYNGETKYTSSANVWLKSTDNLCDEGEVVDFSYTGSPRTYTWNCQNGSKKTSPSCSAKQERCGDGTINGNEDCDDGEKNGTSTSSCSAQCTIVGGASCGAKNGLSTYFDSKQTSSWLSEAMEGLCASGLTVGTPIITGLDSHVEWTCSNTNGAEKTCKAYQEYCGDGVKNGEEDCDGTEFCDSQCNKITPSTGCDQIFTGHLRLGENKVFSDNFNASWRNRYLFYQDVDFEENHGDYNNGSNPTFKRTSQLESNGMMVEANTSMAIIESTPYSIVSTPTTRARDNLYVEYNVWYDIVSHTTAPSKSNLYSHRECVYYEISRCGDGIIDADYGETCDPEAPEWKNGNNGKICNPVTCEPETAPVKGELDIDKTLVGSGLVSKTGDIVTWNIKVTAKGGDVTNFIVTDKLPEVLEYSSYSVVHNPGGLTVSDPTISGNEIIWNVNGTLKEGDYLTIQLKTKAKWMPKVDYKNVACVRSADDPNGEDCDEEEVKLGGIEVEKTLVGPSEIKEVGDIVQWILKVTAVGGAVKNPVIQDIMPDVLGFTGYSVLNNGGLTISDAYLSGNVVTWYTSGGYLANGDYIEIRVDTYVKVMPEKEEKNVLCAWPEDKPEGKDCDDKPIHSPDLWIKKAFRDGSKEKTVKVGDTIAYKIDFGNRGDAAATITSIKDFLPKNVEYVSSEIYVISGDNSHLLNGSEVIGGGVTIEGVYVDIYGGITLNPNTEGYIILTGKILGDYTGNTQNWACIYLNDKKIDCDWAKHNFTGDDKVMCTKPDITNTSFGSDGGSTTVTCKTTPSGGTGLIELNCGNGVVYTGLDVSELSNTCVYEKNETTGSKSYAVVCKVNNETTSDCQSTVTVSGVTPPSTCFIAGTKVTMADGSKKNIEDVKIGEKLLGTDGAVNTVLGYDRPTLGERHLWSINGSEYFVSDEHPFKTTEGWKSFNPEMTKLEVDLDTTELKVGDKLITENGYEEVKTVDYIEAGYDTPLYNFVMDGDHTYYANGYLVHNKGGSSPSCKSIDTNPSAVTDWSNGKDISVICNATSSAYILIDCNYKDGNKYDESNNNYYESSDKVTSFSGVCKNYQVGNKIQCLVKEYKSNSRGTAKDVCGRIKTGGTASTCFIAGTKVTMADGSKKNIEDVKIGEKLLGTDGAVNTVLGYDRPTLGERHLWSINGSEYFVSDEHPFKTTEGWKSFNPEMTKLEVDLDTTELKVGDKLITENGYEEVKTVDYIEAGYDTPLYNFVMDGDHTYYANGYLVHNKGGGGHIDDIIPNNPECFNVNGGNVSIEAWEILPFYWNISKLSDKNIALKYEVVTGYGYGDYDSMKGTGCSTKGNVALNSMICYYSIEDGKGNVVKSGSYPCLDKDRADTGLVAAWIKWQQDTYNKGKPMQTYRPRGDGTNSTFRSNVVTIKNFGSNAKYFGEYSIKMTKIEYLYCNENKKWEGEEWGGVVCQSNFTLTNSYSVQKTPSGNFTQASTDKLRDYLYSDGSHSFEMDKLLSSIAQAESYAPNEAVNDAMDKFIAKYEKLAVNVKLSNSSFLNGSNVRKVPGKNIYFISGDVSVKSSDNNITNPFTIVQTKGNIVINGSSEHNMMLLTKGNITFKGDCTSDQVVKGIFYAGGSLSRSGVNKNDDLNHSYRCSGGGLHVKGVLIGKGLNQLMSDSRSHLNNWFKTTDKTRAIMNGASVLIEYSPSIFTKSTMPPGAEDFTTALSVYKN